MSQNGRTHSKNLAARVCDHFGTLCIKGWSKTLFLNVISYQILMLFKFLKISYLLVQKIYQLLRLFAKSILLATKQPHAKNILISFGNESYELHFLSSTWTYM